MKFFFCINRQSIGTLDISLFINIQLSKYYKVKKEIIEMKFFAVFIFCLLAITCASANPTWTRAEIQNRLGKFRSAKGAGGSGSQLVKQTKQSTGNNN